jgi:peptide/nickel transport system permease protein
MFVFFFQRILQSLVVMLVVAFIAFSLFSYVGDPINSLVGQDTTQEDRDALREELGLNDNFIVQYGRFVTGAVQGDFGTSYRHRKPVSELIAERLPATLELAVLSSIVALMFGIAMGVYTALRSDGFLAKAIMMISLVGVSLPTFLIGILLILLFGVILQWLPSFGRGEVVNIGWWTTGLLTVSGLKALIMPTITLALFQMTLIMRLVRAEMLEVLRMDFIKFARARGLTERIVNFRHALKNTMVPVITITGLQLGSIIAFAIITESVFQWPGMGLLFIQAISEVDFPVIAAYLVMIAAFFVLINFIVDILYLVVDPRLRVNKSAAK